MEVIKGGRSMVSDLCFPGCISNGLSGGKSRMLYSELEGLLFSFVVLT
jgi:hypothetical protein